ncbi:hypothetical protein Poli38472_012482 [Pythium oligandrum]|uniref:C2H2-type domain-containing protein n=1 Tax=Pythium oligandrum TaxID=41045 RepID=A0A8K1FLP5_PYTOL|nr:hypothetical protein Poli38472_012482 [Pythium oligandrum]|eukprot:TMW67366.1 hypothetical protein Poli38472_012482 [Pythium oligandrum]
MYNTSYSMGMNSTMNGLSTSTSSTSSSGYAVYQAHKRQRTEESSKDSSASDSADRGGEGSTDGTQKSVTSGSSAMSSSTTSGTTTYPSMSLNLQKEASWSMLGDVEGFSGLGPMPPVSAVLEKRQFSISSLLPSNISTSGVMSSSNPAPQASNGQPNGQPTAQIIDGSGGNQKFLDASTGEYMYSENVKPMTFLEKQGLVQKITLLPSQYLRGLMDVISKYQPDTVRQIDDDGYAFDLGQMNENTVWAISDYVKDSMIELDGYIRSISAANMGGDENQGGSGENGGLSVQQQLGRHPAHELSLNNPKISAISGNENQGKFLEQVEMYSKPKVTKSRVKPSKKHECPTCQKQFRGRSELQNHVRTHTGEKPLKCSYAGCNKRYAHSSNLRAHERTHAGIKPYACHYDGCGKTFAHSVSLKEHIWMHAGFQPYVCPYEGCEKKFTQVSNFARHKKTHEKEDRREGMESDS